MESRIVIDTNGAVIEATRDNVDRLVSIPKIRTGKKLAKV